MNVLDMLPKKLQAEARELLTKIPYAETRVEAERQKRAFQAWATKKSVAAAGRRLDEDWERLVTFSAFPKEHWKHLRTTNVVESPFAAVRRRTAAAKRFKKVENDGGHLEDPARRGAALPSAGRARMPSGGRRGVVFVDGVREKQGNAKVAA